MHFSTLLLGGALIVSNVLARRPEPACTPSGDNETCLLYWLTNTGIDENLDNPSAFEAWAHATIYSPSCTPLGATTNGLGADVKILAWGLSITDPLVLNAASVPGLGYNTPEFRYNGRVWGYNDCQCTRANIKMQTHVCKCSFHCEDVSVVW